MPALSPTMTTGNIVAWNVSVGYVSVVRGVSAWAPSHRPPSSFYYLRPAMKSLPVTLWERWRPIRRPCPLTRPKMVWWRRFSSRRVRVMSPWAK